MNLASLICAAGVAWLTIFSSGGLAAEVTNSAAPARTEDANSMEMMRAYLQLQEQLHSTQLAVEQSRQESRDLAEQSAKLLAGRLRAVEEALGAQRARELDAMQSSNRVMLIIAGSFASVGILGMVLMAVFQWRAMHRLAEISGSFPLRGLGVGPAMGALGTGESNVVAIGPAEQSNMRLLGALERLEQRIHQLEHTPAGTPKEKAQLQDGASNANGHGPQGENTNGIHPAKASRVELLLAKGQSLLDSDQASLALDCFDEAIELEPKNAEALLRKGAALERLQMLDAAAECYDRAIAADNSMTIAYLHKGGLFNRMERFTEALACYEQALRTQEKRQG
jgi:tetratricopeptide (TPR) repeat protein